MVAYATDTRVSMVRGYDNFQTLTGTWKNTHTGQRADLSIGALYTLDNTALQRLFDAATAVHIHLSHSALATAGIWLYSGMIDSIEIAGREGDMYRYLMTYHCNAWSSY